MGSAEGAVTSATRATIECYASTSWRDLATCTCTSTERDADPPATGLGRRLAPGAVSATAITTPGSTTATLRCAGERCTVIFEERRYVERWDHRPWLARRVRRVDGGRHLGSFAPWEHGRRVL